ncbi:hypothetical protein [Niabella aurantiaca]|uniref:hypothetical protein n=1 Tax=Niabella aurantiaca TaxID=379900 RepID=UPI00036957AF|nr:hypothetical protein [Niabella aurantiaca]
MSKKQIAIKIANANNFDSASFFKEWKGYAVYEAFDETDADETPIVGYPTFIVVDGAGKGRMATPNEIFEIMDSREQGPTGGSL